MKDNKPKPTIRQLADTYNATYARTVRELATGEAPIGAKRCIPDRERKGRIRTARAILRYITRKAAINLYPI